MIKNKTTALIVAVSGGADSLALLHMLWHANLHSKSASLFSSKMLLPDATNCTNLLAAHFNHNLRPSADGDAKYVEDFCKNLGIPCVVGSGDVAKYAKENKLSLETAGRILRYSFFADIGANVAKEVPISQNRVHVATAHHKNDSAESFVMHLLRGCGLGGLCGISPEMNMKLPDERTIHLVRPLLNMTKSDILEYCRENDITPLEDETNDDTAFFRNKIRHEVMPILCEHGALESINRTAQILREDESYLNELTQRWIDEHGRRTIKHGCVFARADFISLHTAQKRRITLHLARELTAETVPLERVDAAIEMIENNLGNKTIQFPDGIEISLHRGCVSISR